MILRTCTIIRGILARFNCDVSAARVWEPYARRALARAGIEAPLPEKTAAEEAAEAEEQEGRAASGGDAGAGPASEAGADGAGGVSVGGAWVHPLLLQPKARYARLKGASPSRRCPSPPAPVRTPTATVILAFRSAQRFSLSPLDSPTTPGRFRGHCL